MRADPDVDYQQEMQDESFLRRGRYRSAPRQTATNEKVWVIGTPVLTATACVVPWRRACDTHTPSHGKKQKERDGEEREREKRIR